MVSVIQATSVINPKGTGKKKVLSEALMLTSLVDAFSILVIFLLLNFSNSENFLVLSKDIELPIAKQWAQLEKASVIKIEADRVFIGEESVAPEDLVKKLVELKRATVKLAQELGVPEMGIIIQADRKAKYKLLNPVLSALATAGFSDLNFAVIEN